MLLLANYLNEDRYGFVGHAPTIIFISEKWYLLNPQSESPLEICEETKSNLWRARNGNLCQNPHYNDRQNWRDITLNNYGTTIEETKETQT